MLPLAACEQATVVAAEKLIEVQARKEGLDARVQLAHSGTTTATTATIAQGRATKIESGVAQLTEADLGAPLHPGAQLEGSGSRVTGPDRRAQLMPGDEIGRGGLRLSIGAGPEGTGVTIQHIVSGLHKP